MKKKLLTISSLALLLISSSIMADEPKQFRFVCSKNSNKLCVIGVDLLAAKDKGYAINAVGGAQDGGLNLDLKAINYTEYNLAHIGIGVAAAVGAIAVIAGGALALGVATTGSISGGSLIATGTALQAGGAVTGSTMVGAAEVATVTGAAIPATATVGGTFVTGTAASAAGAAAGATTASAITGVAAAIGAAVAGAVPTYNVAGRAGGVYLADPKTGKATNNLDGSCQDVFRKMTVKNIFGKQETALKNGNKYEIYLRSFSHQGVKVTSTDGGYKDCSFI